LYFEAGCPSLRASASEWFGALVVPPEEGFNSLAQLFFALEASPVKCFALQQAEHDFNLVQPTGRSRREVKPDSPSNFTSQSSFLYEGIVVQDDVDLLVLR